MSATLDTPTVEQWSGKDRGDENFPVGVLIRPALRPHVHAFYAFARNADDIADSPELSAEDKVARLDVMEAALTEGAPGAPSATRLRASLAETGTTPRHATDLLIAFRRDATKGRYADWDELIDYCRYSAMPVGRHVLELHGESPDTWVPSDPLCAALQVLNHMQDCAKDLAELDRCYLPLDLLAKYGASVDDVRGSAESTGLRATFREMLDRVDALNEEGRALPQKTQDRRLRLETAVIVGLSQRLARRLRDGDPLAARVRLTKTDAASSLLAAFPYFSTLFWP